jgi:TonB family protein
MAYLGPSLRRRKLRERPAMRVVAALGLSLLANLALLALLVASGVFDVKVPRDVKPIALAPLSAEQWEKNRALDGAAAPAAPAPKPAPAARPPQRAEPKPPEEVARGQVVDVAPSKDNRAPEKETRFLADRDNRVEKETRSRHAGTKLWENTLPAPSEGDPKAKARPAPGEGGTAERGAPGREGAPPRPSPAPPKPAGEQLALAPRADEGNATLRMPGLTAPAPPSPGSPGLPGPDAGPQAADGEGGERRSGAKVDLRPDAAMLARIAGGPAPDRLDGVEEGDATALNTRAFRYAGYYRRVYRAIYSNWDANGAYNARDPDGRMYPRRDRTTAVEIVLDASGNLESARIVASSGLDFLDQEALRSVQEASPFPNPPSGLVRDGKVRLGVWEWTLVMDTPSTLPGRRALP